MIHDMIAPDEPVIKNFITDWIFPSTLTLDETFVKNTLSWLNPNQLQRLKKSGFLPVF